MTRTSWDARIDASAGWRLVFEKAGEGNGADDCIGCGGRGWVDESDLLYRDSDHCRWCEGRRNEVCNRLGALARLFREIASEYIDTFHQVTRALEEALETIPSDLSRPTPQPPGVRWADEVPTLIKTERMMR